MFGKEGGEQQAAISSILGSGCKFTGDVDAKGSIRVDGEFEGKIMASDSVLVGKGGVVKGEIHSSHAAVSGTVEGNIFAKRKVELESGSRLIGDVESMSLIIEDGVFFEGRSKMKKEAEGYTPKPTLLKDSQGDRQKDKEKAKVKE
jgi:cytoskeletal protein CcmA (bactofilin family)